jgi:hypothetical protein
LFGLPNIFVLTSQQQVSDQNAFDPSQTEGVVKKQKHIKLCLSEINTKVVINTESTHS